MHLLYKLGKLILNLLKHYIFVLVISYTILLSTTMILGGTENSVYPNIFVLSYHELFDSDSVLGLWLKLLVAVIYITCILIYKLIKKMRKEAK